MSCSVIGAFDAQENVPAAGGNMMLQQDEPKDYVIATGIAHSIRRLLEVAFGHLNLDYRKYVDLDAALLRPAEVSHLIGNSSKAERELGWKPTIGFEQLIKMMVEEDMARVRNGQTLHLTEMGLK